MICYLSVVISFFIQQLKCVPFASQVSWAKYLSPPGNGTTHPSFTSTSIISTHYYNYTTRSPERQFWNFQTSENNISYEKCINSSIPSGWFSSISFSTFQNNLLSMNLLNLIF